MWRDELLVSGARVAMTRKIGAVCGDVGGAVYGDDGMMVNAMRTKCSIDFVHSPACML